MKWLPTLLSHLWETKQELEKSQSLGDSERKRIVLTIHSENKTYLLTFTSTITTRSRFDPGKNLAKQHKQSNTRVSKCDLI